MASHSQVLCGGTHRVPSLAFASLTAGTRDCHCTREVLVLKHGNIMCAMLTCGSDFITFKDSGIQEFVGFCLKAPNSLINTFFFHLVLCAQHHEEGTSPVELHGLLYDVIPLCYSKLSPKTEWLKPTAHRLHWDWVIQAT